MEDNTSELLKKLNRVDTTLNLDNYLEQIDGTYTGSLGEYLMEQMKTRGLEKADLYKLSKIERTYCYQILEGKRNPSRDKIVCIALALKLNLIETQRALEIAKAGVLYAKSRRDSIIIFAINNKMNIIGLNDLLKQYGERELE